MRLAEHKPHRARCLGAKQTRLISINDAIFAPNAIKHRYYYLVWQQPIRCPVTWFKYVYLITRRVKEYLAFI